MRPLLTLHCVAVATLAVMAVSSTPAVANDVPSLFGHKPKTVPPKIYPVLENRYIKQFSGPTISPCGPCFGFHKTQWRSWADACGEPHEAAPTRVTSSTTEEAPAPTDADKKEDKNGNGEKKDDKKPEEKKPPEKNSLLSPPPILLIPKVDTTKNDTVIPVPKATIPISIPVLDNNLIVAPRTLTTPQFPEVKLLVVPTLPTVQVK